MKPVVECGACSKCAIGYGTGFTGRETLHCSLLGDYVTREDGCTMGEPGEPGSLCAGWDITIGGHEAVNGW